MAEAWRGSERCGEGFAGLGRHFAYHKAPKGHFARLIAALHTLPRVRETSTFPKLS